jgi:antitoxin ParD1/3/4
MNVSLGTKWERFVDAKVKSGDFQTASEVLREGLRLLEEKEQLKRISVSSLEELQTKLMQGISSLEKGQGIEGEEAFRLLRERVKQHKARG